MSRKPTEAERLLLDALQQGDIAAELKQKLLGLLDDVSYELDTLWQEKRDLRDEVDELEGEVSDLEDKLDEWYERQPTMVAAQDERFRRALSSVLRRDDVYSAEELKFIAEEVGVLEAV